MATKSKRACRQPGCRALTDDGWCEAHRPAKRKSRPWRTTVTSAHKRGYGAVWRRLRIMVLARDPVCVVCRRVPAIQADHIVPKASGGADVLANLRGLCRRCHDRKTAADAREARIRAISETIKTPW